MLSGGNFYIYGGGRWREVDISDGCVDGWGRVRFAYAKRGKVHVAKNRAVLTALRQLKANEKSAIRDGARLPDKRIQLPHKSRIKPLETSECDHSKCCHHSISHGSPRKIIQPSTLLFPTTKQSSKIDVSIQTSLSSQDSRAKSVQQTEKKRKITSDENIDVTKTAASTNITPEKINKLKLKRRSIDQKVSHKKVPSLKLLKADSTKYNLYKRKRTESSDSLIWVVMPKNKEDEKKITYNGEEFTKTKILDRNKRVKESSDNSEESQPQKLVKNNSQTDITNAKLIEETKHKNRNTHVTNSKDLYKSNKQEISTQTGRDKFKELIIEEEDVEVLRNYLINSGNSFDLLRFDEDDDYKRQFFYTINPLVNVQRCRKISRMIRGDSQSEVSLKDFASQLGLTSVSDIKAPKRYRMRNRTLDRETEKSDDTDKENSINSSVKKSVHLRKIRNKLESASDLESEVSQNRRNEKNEHKYKTRQSLADRKGSDSENDAVQIYVPKNTKKFDPNESDSSVIIDNSRILRSTKANNSIDISSDSEVIFKKLNKRDKKVNKAKRSKVTNIDLTKSDWESDWESEISNSETSTNDDAINGKGKKNKYDTRKNNSNKNEEINEIDSDDETDTFKRTILERNKKGRFLKKVIKINEAKETQTKNRKQRTEHDKNKSIDISANSEDEFATKDMKLKKIQHNTNNNKSKSKQTIDTESDNEVEVKKNSKINDQRKDVTENQEVNRNISKNDDIRNFVVSIAKGNNTSRKKNLNTVRDNNTSNSLNESENMSICVIGETKSLAKTRDVEKRAISPAPSLSRTEYSNLEDHAIITWISVGGRARCVNGNRIWKELQDKFRNIVGHYRSWHSLRNRYLRSILPRLGQMALTPSEVSRLRAAAATGEIKTKNSSRRNSIFAAPTAGALSRRPRRRSPSSDEELPAKRHRHDHTKLPSEPSSRVLRKSNNSLKNERSPRYSEITRHFAQRHRESTPTSASESVENRSRENSTERRKSTRNSLATNKSEKKQETKSPSKNPSQTKTSKNTPESKNSKTPTDTKQSKNISNDKSSSKNTSSERSKSKSSGNSLATESANKSLRKSLRNSSPTKKESEKSPQKERNKTRRLFNPSSFI